MTISPQQQKRAATFQAMHTQKELFILPNIWNAGGARAVEKSGFNALATTSAGIAFANGYPDGESFPFEQLIASVQQITSRITIPLSVDFERGYSENPQKIQENTRQLLYAGAVGLNLEDGLPDKKISESHSMQEKLAALTPLKKELNLDFLINARIDTYWNQIGTPSSRLAETITRANHYISWGADCVFVPGNIPLNELEVLLKEVEKPINILLNNELKNIPNLQKIGVKRVSLGSALSRNSIHNFFHQMKEIKAGHFDSLLDDSLPYESVNQFFID
ncbi:isocitrate lyase/phosphoenolpyruvate mutase family protein [Vagococcus entomophilus]|uniref:Carboxyvinyl-carboxyphosphonate phosphorylmutase n=1 Tax=Vagococcus entomophilus TaxID=1160095 RepID=A0A430AF24_9ENTE|nr:isocitrate lyase/phosphoenolpyruvate mutase family protein [Vagococcus entomophilus]RSU06181.1 hypothetical protein CBF30_10720 [Vagococcus entomophilus]